MPFESAAERFRERFIDLCRTLEIDPGSDPDIKLQYAALVKRVTKLVTAHELVHGNLHLAKPSAAKQGCPRALKNALEGSKGPQPETVLQLCFRLLGFLSTEIHAWQRPMGSAAQSYGDIVRSLLSDAVMRRIADHCRPDGGPGYEIYDSIQAWAEYLCSDRSDRPASVCWESSGASPPLTGCVRWFSRSHDGIAEILASVGKACVDISFLGVSFSVSTVQGRDAFLSALKHNVRLRFLLFDFVNGDLEGSAQNLGLSVRGLARRCVDTIEALKQLSVDITRDKLPGQLEVSLFSSEAEPGVRVYIVDEHDARNGLTFAYTRLPRMSDGPGILAPNAERDIAQFYGDIFRDTWRAARPWQTWMTEYEAWRARPAAREILDSESDTAEHD